MRDLLRANQREAFAILVLAVLVTGYLATHPAGPTTYVITIWANQALILTLAAIAQFFAVIVRGIDLSVGAVMALTNCVASYLVIGSGLDMAFGICVVLLVGAGCGLLNGLLVVYGRIQPIVVTLATASLFVGIALLLRPTPGGQIDYDLADAMTLDVLGIPTALIITAAVIGLIGGTSILGGRGSLVGTFGGVLFITLLTSILSVMQISDGWRNIIFGVIILAMLLLQTLRKKAA